MRNERERESERERDEWRMANVRRVGEKSELKILKKEKRTSTRWFGVKRDERQCLLCEERMRREASCCSYMARSLEKMCT